jgi:hypothetical protein
MTITWRGGYTDISRIATAFQMKMLDQNQQIVFAQTWFGLDMIVILYICTV